MFSIKKTIIAIFSEDQFQKKIVSMEKNFVMENG